MAPAPIPADPTLLTSPLTNSNARNTSSCASRRFSSPVALSSIEESQQIQRPTNIYSVPKVVSVTKETPLNKSSYRQTSDFSCVQKQTDTNKLNLKAELSITTLDAIEENRSNDIPISFPKKADEDTETSLVHEVRRSYNRLSLNNKVIS